MRIDHPLGLKCWLMSSAEATKKKRAFDPHDFLATIGDGRKIQAVPKKQTIFAQGDVAEAVFYVQKGKVRLTVVSKIGREAMIGIVSGGDFFGKG
jgi:CRP/FNR family cyclic AMP-dependent transcriptional regulator